MKIVIFTSDGIRHKYFANSLRKYVDETLVISEYKKTIKTNKEKSTSTLEKHFQLRNVTEKKFFPDNDFFHDKVISIAYKEANSEQIFQIVKKFNPDLMVVFGSSIIKEPLLSLKPGRFINLHLGLSPYYRGSGTNFWPFINKELEYVGSTILHLDPGIDTGDIITHVIPRFEIGDNVHTVGCKVIQESVNIFYKIIENVKQGKELKRTKQFEVLDSKYYKNSDFNEDILKKYIKNLENGIIENYLTATKKQLKLITLDND